MKKYESADEFEKALDEQIRLDMERELLAKVCLLVELFIYVPFFRAEINLNQKMEFQLVEVKTRLRKNCQSRFVSSL